MDETEEDLPRREVNHLLIKEQGKSDNACEL